MKLEDKLSQFISITFGTVASAVPWAAFPESDPIIAVGLFETNAVFASVKQVSIVLKKEASEYKHGKENYDQQRDDKEQEVDASGHFLPFVIDSLYGFGFDSGFLQDFGWTSNDLEDLLQVTSTPIVELLNGASVSMQCPVFGWFTLKVTKSIGKGLFRKKSSTWMTDSLVR